jgi:hypothetical protein
MLLKERASGMYRVSAFYLASACSDLPMDCAYPVMFVVSGGCQKGKDWVKKGACCFEQ